MKLLLDQNLSPRLVRRLSDLYPDSAHVADLGLGEASDLEIWQHASESGSIIVSKDSDFEELLLRMGFPPKVLWVRKGNCSTREIEEILRRDVELVADFEQDDDLGLLVLY